MKATWWTDPSQLDNEQKSVVSLPPDGHYLVLGPPGSGKTNLLLLRATYLHRLGITNIVVLTFGRVLREFLASGTAHYPFADDKIQTYIKWAKDLLHENGIDVESTNFKDLRKELLAKLCELASQERQHNVCDCIMLDEAQDYSAEEINVIKKFTNRLFAVGDSSQRITAATGGLEALESGGSTVTKLTAHYRNGLSICRVADGILNLLDQEGGMEETSNYDEATFPSSVTLHQGMTIEDQATIAAQELETQLTAYPDELIGVLCPKQDDLHTVAGILEQSKIADQVHLQHGDYTPFDPERRIVLATIHGAKGLEFRAVHLLGMNHVSRFKNQKKMCYTAVTRCKTSLSVYCQSAVPGYLEKGLQACHSPPVEPSFNELFR